MEVKQARHRPVLVDYAELTEDNGAAVAEWCGGEWVPEYGVVLVPTIHGQIRATPGHLRYVVKGTHDFYPIRADAFAAGYEDIIEAHPASEVQPAGFTCDCGRGDFDLQIGGRASRAIRCRRCGVIVG
jgi:hypothetical protein